MKEMRVSQENQEQKKEEKNKNDNIDIINSQEDLININNINNSERKLFDNTKRSDNNKNNNYDPNDSNVLNYNYLETERINLDEEDDIYNNLDNNKSLEEIINKLKEENKELKNDMK